MGHDASRWRAPSSAIAPSLAVFVPDQDPLPLPPGHRFPAEKYRLLRDTLLADGLLDARHLRPSPPAAIDEIVRAHDPRYVQQMLDGTLPAAIAARIGLPWSDILLARSLATVGGTLAAARHALMTGVSGQLAGGTHHAHRDGGAGFCVFNDCAVAALTLLAERAVGRVAVLDLDVHHGDGNATILSPDPRVFVASVHGANNYPFEKPPSDFDLPLSDGTADDAYLAACDHALEAVLSFRPDVVFYIAGVDPLISDRLGRLAVTHEGLFRRDERVITGVRRAGVALVVLIGGGYGEPISESIAAYANTWRAVRSVCG